MVESNYHLTSIIKSCILTIVINTLQEVSVSYTKQFVTGIALNDRESKIVKELANSKGLSFSAALRMIINEWAEMRKEYVRVPIVDKLK